MSVRNYLLGVAEQLGYRIEKISTIPPAELPEHDVTDLEALVEEASTIPGMLSAEAGKFLYALCYMQKEQGDVVEVGSWQGYSTSFLGRAVKDSGNGRLHAVDHFQGNIGKESFYVVGEDDLSDLKANFLRNMERLELSEHVTLHDMPNDRAAAELSEERVRFLFIDGDHSREGVEKDIRLFFPLLIPGAIVVFDDFTGAFPGLVGAVDDLLSRRDFRRKFSFEKTLVLKCT